MQDEMRGPVCRELVQSMCEDHVQSDECTRTTCEGSLLQPALAQLLQCTAGSCFLLAPAPSHCCVKVPFGLILAPVPVAGKNYLSGQHHSLQGQLSTHPSLQESTSVL